MGTVSISAGLIASNPTPPLQNARIVWNNPTPATGWTSPTDDAPLSDNTYDFYSVPSGTQYYVLEPDGASVFSVNAVGIVFKDKTLTDGITELEVQTSPDGVIYSTVAYTFPSVDLVNIGLFSDALDAYLRIKIVSTGGAKLAVVKAGRALEMERAIYAGRSPDDLARRTVAIGNKSDSGQFLGRYTIRRGLNLQYTWSNLSDDFIRDEFEAFIDHAEDKSFFVAWRPISEPKGAVYAWTKGPIQVTNNGKADLKEATMNCDGYRENISG